LEPDEKEGIGATKGGGKEKGEGRDGKGGIEASDYHNRVTEF